MRQLEVNDLQRLTIFYHKFKITFWYKPFLNEFWNKNYQLSLNQLVLFLNKNDFLNDLWPKIVWWIQKSTFKLTIKLEIFRKLNQTKKIDDNCWVLILILVRILVWILVLILVLILVRILVRILVLILVRILVRILWIILKRKPEKLKKLTNFNPFRSK